MSDFSLRANPPGTIAAATKISAKHSDFHGPPAIRTGWDLASWKKELLSVTHLTTALEASETFEVDFKGAGSTDQMRAYT